MNSFFGYAVIENLKLISFDDSQTKFKKNDNNENSVTIGKYTDKISKISKIKNEKIKKSLLELTKIFKQK